MSKSSTSTYSTFDREFNSSNVNWTPTTEYTVIFLRAQQNYANDLLKSRGHLFLNEVYDMLGFSRVSDGQLLGWIYEGDATVVDFGIFDQTTLKPLESSDPITLHFNVQGMIYDKI